MHLLSPALVNTIPQTPRMPFPIPPRSSWPGRVLLPSLHHLYPLLNPPKPPKPSPSNPQRLSIRLVSSINPPLSLAHTPAHPRVTAHHSKTGGMLALSPSSTDVGFLSVGQSASYNDFRLSGTELHQISASWRFRPHPPPPRTLRCK